MVSNSLGSRAHVMRTRQLHARLYVFVSTYRWHWHSDIICSSTAPKTTPRSRTRPLPGHYAEEVASRPRQPCEKSPARANALQRIAYNAKALGYLFARLAGSRDARKATARTLACLRATLPSQTYQIDLPGVFNERAGLVSGKSQLTIKSSLTRRVLIWRGYHCPVDFRYRDKKLRAEILWYMSRRPKSCLMPASHS
jgi:hypothetical protein